jgi:hypothetical protein
MKVEELSQYGKTLSGLPKEAIKKQKSIVFQKIKNKLGFFGLIPFMIKMLFEQKKLKSKYPQVFEDSKNKLTIIVSECAHCVYGRKVKWDVSFNK